MTEYERGSGRHEEATLGVDPTRSRLWAQVRRGVPEMRMDDGGLLRPAAWPGGGRRVFLGDVGRAALAALGTHEVPEFEQQPGYDEQRWRLKATAGDLIIDIRSAPYWGFGLLARCFLNEIRLTGPLEARARFAYDFAVALHHDPWLPVWRWPFRRATGAGIDEHRAAWNGLIEAGRETLREDIERVRVKAEAVAGRGDESSIVLLDAARDEIGRAEAALLERNAPALGRALARAERVLLHADPDTRPEDEPEDASTAGESLTEGMARQEATDVAIGRSHSDETEDSPPKENIAMDAGRSDSEREGDNGAEAGEVGGVGDVGVGSADADDGEEIPFVDLT